MALLDCWPGSKLRSLFLRSYRLLASMRFAIALLVVIATTASLGSVVPQKAAYSVYVNQYGLVGAEWIVWLQLNAVYTAWWFVLMLVFLVLSTSLCIIRNTPRYVAELRGYKEDIAISSLRTMRLRLQGECTEEPHTLVFLLAERLSAEGWKSRVQVRIGKREGAGWLLTAKAGQSRGLGYFATHGAIVLICVGGLIDSDLLLHAQVWLGHKQVVSHQNGMGDLAPSHLLAPGNVSYRGNVVVTEGATSGTAVLDLPDGFLLQSLPFLIELRQFAIEFYADGTPKNYASDIVLHDRETGDTQFQRVQVNQPIRWRGVEIFQAGFDDGGSCVVLQPQSLIALSGAEAAQREGLIHSQVGSTLDGGEAASLLPADKTLEILELRVRNIEDMRMVNFPELTDAPPPSSLNTVLKTNLGAASQTAAMPEMRDIGPSITYRLRDSTGQGVEFRNYMHAIDRGQKTPVYMLGVRQEPAEAFAYWRIPQDVEGSMQSFLLLLRALRQAPMREQAVQAYVEKTLQYESDLALREQLQMSASRVLEIFAGAQVHTDAAGVKAGLPALSRFVTENVAETERSQAGDIFLKILHGVLLELLQSSRQHAGLPEWASEDAAVQAFMQQAVFALSDAFFYPEPLFFTLDSFEQVQASVFQVARSPGRVWVYGGFGLLIVGIFAMLYLQEKRFWIWLQASEPSEKQEHAECAARSRWTMAMSTNRQTLNDQNEFSRLCERILKVDENAINNTKHHDK